MRKDVGVDGDAQRIGQLVWMLFLKIFDDRELEWELMDDSYRSPIPDSCRWRTWAADPEGMTGEALKDFIDNNLFPPTIDATGLPFVRVGDVNTLRVGEWVIAIGPLAISIASSVVRSPQCETSTSMRCCSISATIAAP